MAPVLEYSQLENTEAVNTKQIRDMRRHCCCLLLKLVKLYGQAMLPHLEDLFSTINNLMASPNPPKLAEKGILVESLLVLNNHKSSVDEKRALIARLLEPTTNLFSEKKDVLRSTTGLLSHLGVDRDPATQDRNHITYGNRGELVFAFNLIEIVAKSCSDAPHPSCAELLQQLVLPLLAIIRAINGLVRPEVVATFHPSLAGVHSLPAHQKRMVLGVTGPPNEEQDSSNVKVRFIVVTWYCYWKNENLKKWKNFEIFWKMKITWYCYWKKE